MRKLFAALVGVATLAACGLDPTQKHDYSCTADVGSGGAAAQGCSQFRVTEVEGNLAQIACEDKGGAWAYHACATANRTAGYCEVPSAADYSLSGTPAKVYFYDPVIPAAAQAACESVAGNVWHP
jgi:hypothetical protein